MIYKHFLYPLFSSLLLICIIGCKSSESPEVERIIGEIDTEMGGDLEVTGVVYNNQGNEVPIVFVVATAYSPGGGGDEGNVGDWALYTDILGKYSFQNFNRDTIGHIEIWFNGGREYGRKYENCGYSFWNVSNFNEEKYTLDVVVHPVTNSGISAEILFVDSDGITKNLVHWEDSFIGLERGTNLGSGHEYPIGSEYGEIEDGKVNYMGLAGGTYFFVCHFTKTNGHYVDRNSNPFNIPEGEILNYQYTVE